MRQVKALAASAVLALAVTAAANSASVGTTGATARAWPRGEASIGYSSDAALRAALARYPARIVSKLPSLRVVQVRPSGSVPGFAANVARLPGIRFVERLAAREQSIDPALLPSAGRSLPWEWQYSATRADTVPERILRDASAITIAVIDTGADVDAPDLAAKTPNSFNERTGTADVRDTVGHGTFVSALAAGSITNDDGIAGFGGDAKLLVIKAGSGDGSFTDVDEANAIVYAVDRGARIINLSLGGTATSATERRAIDYAAVHGVLLVAAAGNEHYAGNPVEYPAALLQPVGSMGFGGRGLAVGASTTSGVRASFSNTGSYLSLLAPGENVLSALSAASSPLRFPRVSLPGASGLYGFASGTSFAAPEVAGAAALVWAANPLLDAASVAQVLKETATGGGSWTPELGWGVLDVGAAVARASGMPPPTAAAILRLNGSLARRLAKVTVTLRSTAPGIAAGGRAVTLDIWNGAMWRSAARGVTTGAGSVTLRLKLHAGKYRMRARWGGAADLSGAVSAPIVFRVA